MLAVVLGSLGMAACGGDSASREDVMADVAADIAVPAFTELRERAAELAAAIESACAQPADPSFDGVAGAVAAARTAWYESEAVWVGPVMERRSSGVVDWPVNNPEIVELLGEAQPGDLTAEYLGRSVGADNRGLDAIAWVASSPGELDDSDPAIRCEYLSGLAEVIVTETELVANDWTESFEDGPAYGERLAGAGDAGGVDEQVDMVVNDTLATLESMKDVPDAPSSAVQVARLKGERQLYAGDGDEIDGLSPLLGDGLSERLASELDTAISAYEAGDVVAGSAAANDAQRTVATEVVSKLGVTVGFSDADGDSGG